jgi:phospholipid/cholesterol/gamma-HCH transport system substrate-binding protein
VEMQIDQDAELPASIRAQIRFRNLVGQRMVVLEADPELGIRGVMEPNDVIPIDRTEPAFDLTLLFNGLRPVIRSTNPRDINIVSRALVEALSGRGPDIKAFLGDVADLSQVVAASDQELSTVLDNVNVLTADLGNRDAQLQRTLGNIGDFLTDISDSKDDLDRALVSLDDAARRLGRIVEVNDDDIKAELKDLEILLDAVNDKRSDLRGAIKALPKFLVGVERVNSYGQWSGVHLIDVCKDDIGDCGTRGTP